MAMTERKADRFTVQEFRDIEHALQMVVALTSHTRGCEVAHELLAPEGEKAIRMLRRWVGFAN